MISLDLDDNMKNQDKFHEIRKETHLNQIFSEIIQNKYFKNLTLENTKYIRERRKNTDIKIGLSYNNQRDNKNKSSQEVFCFNQTSFKINSHFFKKQNEREIISSQIIITIKNVYKK